jgi:hypothetical protein
VSHSSSIEPFCFDYELVEPYEARGEEIKGFKIIPPRWSVYEKTTAIEEFKKGEGQIKQDLIHGCIYGLIGEDKPRIIIQEDLDEMGKTDIEKLSNKINDINVGPNMLVEAKCSICKYEFITQINWNYDSFFVVSSR